MSEIDLSRRPTERLITANDLPHRDMWYDPEEIDPHIDALEAKVAWLTEALERIRGMCDVPDNRYGTRAVYVCADTALSHAPDHTGEADHE